MEKVSTVKKNSSITFPKGQIMLLILLLAIGSVTIIVQGSVIFNTILLFFTITIIGFILCLRLQDRLNDPKLKILGYFWLLKLCITLILLFIGWMPLLDPSSANWGYDPQRYYYQAQELTENHWIFIGGLNYLGILYYYGAIFFIFGHNPIIPALFNSFVTLLATLYVISFAYEINPYRQTRDWTIAWALLLPEILWFDVITSRETLLGALLIIVFVTFGRLIIRSKQISIAKYIFILSLTLLIIAAVRTSMLLPVIGSIILLFLLKKTKQYIRFYQLIAFGIIFFVIFSMNNTFTTFIGGDAFDVGKAINSSLSTKDNIVTLGSESMEYSKNSISQILLPEGLFQSIIFMPPRMILYLLAPLPNISVSFIELIDGNWRAWQKLLTILSSIINIFAMPYILAATIQAIRTRKENIASLTLIIPFWLTFIAIAGGNLIIHERYRVMAALLLWACAWLGARSCSRALIKKTTYFWNGLLFSGALFYISYKFIFA